MKIRTRTRPRRRAASPALIAGAVLTALILLAALLAPVIAPYSPSAQNLANGLQAPSLEHWFGTDQLGRDIFSRVLYAARTDLSIAVLAAITPFAIGVMVGLLTGYFGGHLRGAVGWVSARITDTFIAFPFYVLVIAIVFAVGAGEVGIIVTFAIVGWVGYARVLGAMTAALRDAEWVRAARGVGLSHARVIFRHVLPNVLPQAIVLLATEIVLIMVAIVTLGYLGLGIQPPTPDWGTMIADGQLFITSHWWLSAMPGLAVVITGIAFSLLGDGVGDLLRIGRDPSRRARVRRGTKERSDVRGRSGERGAVRVRNLSIFDRSGAALVDRVGFDVAPGESLGIVGESGSGKSLTLRAVLGMLPSGTRFGGGQVLVGGRVGMVFQDPLTALDPLTRVGVQVREAVRARGKDARGPVPAVTDLLRDVGLDDARRIARSYPHQLSGGQRQRVVIAMALAGDPDVLLCDEPTTALDVTVQRQVLELLARLRRERGLTLVFVSHDLAVVASVGERVAVMRAGRIVETGPTARVVRAPEDPYTWELLAALPRLPALAAAPPGAPAPARPIEWAGPHRYSAEERCGPALRDEAHEGSLLRVEGLEVRYGRSVAVRGASFAVDPGAALGIVGESGSGKTTLARAIVGQLPVSAGRMLLSGAPLPRHRGAALRRAVQLVPQDPYSSLNPRMTAGAAISEVAGPARVEEMFTLVRLDPSFAAAYPFELSGGQRQRVAIARALAASPRVLVADEPTSALDVSVQAEIIELLQGLRRDLGVALVFVSHDLAVVHELCDEVVVMRGGEIVEHGGAGFFERPQHEYTRGLLAAVPRL